MSEKKTTKKQAGYSPLLATSVAGLILLSSLVYLIARSMLPSDGSKIVLEDLPEQRGGLIVEPLTSNSSFLEGDVVLGFGDRSLDSWLADPLASPPPSARLEKGQYVSTDLIRDGAHLDIQTWLGSFPLGQELQQRWTLYFFLVYLELMSIVVFIRRPRMPVAQAFFLVSTAIFSSGLIFFLGLQITDLLRPWLLALWIWGAIILYGLMTSGLLHFAFIFPEGAIPTSRRRLALLAIYGGVWLPYLLLLAFELRDNLSPVETLLQSSRGTAIMTLTYFPLVLIVSVLRYRQNQNEIYRRQMRWILWALVVTNVPWLLLTAVPALFGDASHLATSLTGLLWCAIPTAFAISILRERLFDIDVIIRKTLLYGALTGLLALVYFGSVLLLQTLVEALTGGSSPIIIVISTLLIAALFAPLRSGLQRAIDRRFFRQKYDAQQVLARFAETARDEVELETLTAELLRVTRETVQPESVTIWLK